MSIHAVAEVPLATKDAQVIADMAAAVLASIARIHAEGLGSVSALAEAPRPIRVELPPAAEPESRVVPEDHQAAVEAAVEVEEAEEPAELVADPLEYAASAQYARYAEATRDDDLVVRIAEPRWVAPQPRGRHFSEAVTDQLPAQSAA